MATTPCTRHAKNVWMAYCSDCAAWHLHRQIALGIRSPAAGTPVRRPSPAGMSGLQLAA
jgi:hypothetical protein